jgi:hypothetical protein
MITTAATNAQAAYYNHPRFPLLGTLQKNGTVATISPATPPSPPPKIQPELF